MNPNDSKFPRVPCWGKGKVKVLVPGRERTCLSGRELTWVWHLIRQPLRTDHSWTLMLSAEHPMSCPALFKNTVHLLLKQEPHVRTPKIGLGVTGQLCPPRGIQTDKIPFLCTSESFPLTVVSLVGSYWGTDCTLKSPLQWMPFCHFSTLTFLRLHIGLRSYILTIPSRLIHTVGNGQVSFLWLHNKEFYL